MSARLMIRDGDGTIRSLTLAEKATIGAANDADIIIQRERISPIHARITADGDDYWIEDAKSGDGTYVNGEKITRVKLRHFDVITIGRDISLVFLTARPPSARVEAAQPAVGAATISGKTPVAPGGMPKFAATMNEPIANLTPPPRGGQIPADVLRALREEEAPPPTAIQGGGPASITALRLVGDTGNFKTTLGTCIVGRGPEAGVRIDSKEVSRKHAVIVIKPDGITVEDLKSSNGTRVNTTPVTGPTPLKDGDTVAFSGFKFRVEVLRLER